MNIAKLIMTLRDKKIYFNIKQFDQLEVIGKWTVEDMRLIKPNVSGIKAILKIYNGYWKIPLYYRLMTHWSDKQYHEWEKTILLYKNMSYIDAAYLAHRQIALRYNLQF